MYIYIHIYVCTHVYAACRTLSFYFGIIGLITIIIIVNNISIHITTTTLTALLDDDTVFQKLQLHSYPLVIIWHDCAYVCIIYSAFYHI